MKCLLLAAAASLALAVPAHAVVAVPPEILPPCGPQHSPMENYGRAADMLDWLNFELDMRRLRGREILEILPDLRHCLEVTTWQETTSGGSIFRHMISQSLSQEEIMKMKQTNGDLRNEISIVEVVVDRATADPDGFVHEYSASTPP